MSKKKKKKNKSNDNVVNKYVKDNVSSDDIINSDHNITDDNNINFIIAENTHSNINNISTDTDSNVAVMINDSILETSDLSDNLDSVSDNCDIATTVVSNCDVNKDIDNTDINISEDTNNTNISIHDNEIIDSTDVSIHDGKNIDNISADCGVFSDSTTITDDVVSYNNDDIVEDLSINDNLITSNNGNFVEDLSINKEQSSYVMVKKNKSNKKWIILLIVFIVIAVLALVSSTVFGLINLGNTKIIYGTSISGIDVSGLSKEEAFEKVNSAFSEKLASPITLKHNDYETSVFAEQFEVNFDINSAIETAYNKGRTGNIFENNFTIINSYFSSININPSFSYSDESIIALVTEIEPNLPDRAIAPNYSVDGNNLIISKGVDGVIISSAELKGEIIYYFNNLLYKNPIIDIPVENKAVSKVDLNQIHDEIYKAPQDAYYTSNPYVVHPHVDGIDFKISIEEANALLEAEGESCTIPLMVLTPAVTTNQIGPEAFPDLLGQFSTTYNASNYNRSTNISLAASKINGIVIMPGEVFSYNKTVGQRTAAAGFKPAGVYVNGQVSTGIGGGICQVSSTLYNAVLLANLEIVERTNHYFNPGYVEAGKDATVSWGGPDFRFKNNRNYPIKIVCSGTGGKVNFKIWGLHSDDDYEVSIESKYIQSIPYKTIQQKNASLPKGTTKVIESGSNGCKTETYKILKKNGSIVSRTLLSRDTYNPHNRVIAVGN